MEPTIAYNPAPPVNPLEQQARVLAIKNEMTQGQLSQQQLIGATQANTIQAQQIKDQQTVMQTLSQNGGDLAAALPQLAGKVTPQTYMGLAKAHYETREAALKMTSEQLAVEKTQNDNLLGLIDQAKSLPPDQYVQQWPAIAQRAIQIKPQIAQQINPNQPVPQQALDQFAIGIQAHSTIQAQIMKEREVKAQELTAQSHADQAATSKERLAAEMPGGALADPSKAELSDWLKKNPGKGPADFLKYKSTIVPQFNFNMQGGNAKYDANDPSVQAVAEGRMKIGDVMTPRTPLMIRKQFLNAVQSVKPDFDSRDYDVEKGVMKKFTSGNVADQLQAIGVAREHMKTFARLADALDTNDVQVLNKIGQAFGVQFGSDKKTNFDIAAQAFGGEVGRAFDGAGVTAGERQKAENGYKSAMSKGQFRGAIQTVDELLAGKQKGAKDSYEKGIQGKPNFGSDSAAGFSVKAPNGKTYSFKDQQSLDAFKQRAGIQ